MVPSYAKTIVCVCIYLFWKH